MRPLRLLTAFPLQLVFAAALVPGIAHISAQAQMTGPSYDAATIKPSDPSRTGQSWHGENNRVSMENVTLRQLIKVAYDLHADSQVIAGPEWLGKQHFDITARMDDEEYARLDKMSEKDSEKESEALLQRLLADRFGLHVTQETRSLPQYALVVDAGGPKMEEGPKGLKDAHQNMSVHNGKMEAKEVHMDLLASVLSNSPEVGTRVVVDHTGLTGIYNFTLNWARDSGTGGDVDATLPGLFTALKEQLGLRLEKKDGDVPVVVVQAASLPQFD